MDDPAAIRALLLFAPFALGVGLWLLRRPRRPEKTGILFALLWNVVSLLALNSAALRVGWWSFDVAGGSLIGVPVDLLFGWSALWTCLATLVMPRWNLVLVVITAALIGLWLDWLLMPMADPVVVLHDHWLVGELASLAFCLVPSALLARWTAENRRLGWRVVFHVMLFGALMLWVLPEILLAQTGGDWSAIHRRPAWINVTAAQLILIPAVIGLGAVQEFFERGRGTPIPLDPPSRLVTTGVYAYLSNPMQVSMCLVFVGWGLFLESWAVTLAGAMAVVFGLGLGRWATHRQLERRFGRRWADYRSRVRRWWPSWRPRFDANEPPARLYVALACEPCRGIGDWIQRRRPSALELVPAEQHPSGALARMAYEVDEPDGGRYTASGVVALARALEHLHFGWAFIGWIIRLPVLSAVIQVVVDAVGGEKRKVTEESDQ